MNRTYYVYIMGNNRPTLYIGVTNDLIRRVYEHKMNLRRGFTQEYNLKKLLYYELTESIEAAIVREKQLKKWNREWKLRIIQEMNPKFEDLYDLITQ